jgi:nucleoside-triphosphatase THEP1
MFEETSTHDCYSILPLCLGPSVGQYTVILDEFEPLALGCLSDGALSGRNILIIDEIGKMENFRNGASPFFNFLSEVPVFPKHF